MYCELFQLTEPPFRLTPDPQFLFASKQHARAKAYMESTIWLADGFVVITGDIGSGKTTLIESFLADLPEDIVLAHISQTQLSPVEFLQALLVEFGFKPFRKRKVELLSMIKDYMVEQYAAGKKILLIIDEAQNLSRKVLEEVRLLSGLELRKEKLLRIIIAGQPELSHKLDSARLQQLTQRVRLRFHLGALSKRETHEYITHRLEVAKDFRACGVRHRLPLYGRRSAARQHSLRHGNAVCVRRGAHADRRAARQSRRRGAAMGRILGTPTRD
jgi:general secretion pathway protein A